MRSQHLKIQISTLFAIAMTSPVMAMGQLPGTIGGGTASTPAPIAGAGLFWIGAAGVGAYLYKRIKRKRD